MSSILTRCKFLSISSSSSAFIGSTLSPATLVSHQQVAFFSKYISKTRAKHLPLNTKRAGKGYKKGYGARMEGRISSTGTFTPVAAMRTELVVPDLTNFKLKAYVGSSIRKGVTAIKPEASA